MSWPAFSPSWPNDPSRPPDPYACWAAATEGAYLASHTAFRCRLALRLLDPAAIDRIRSLPGVCVPEVYGKSARYCTAEVTGTDQTVWQKLSNLADVALAEPGLAQPDDLAWPLDQMRLAVNPAPPPPRSKHSVVIGVVDGACGFANRQFRSDNGGTGPWRTRLAAYWDQQGEAAAFPSGWDRPPDLGYGRELRMGELDKLFDTHLPATANDDADQAVGERAIYGALGVSLPAAADWTHGTHVLDTVGGPPRLEPLPQRVSDDKILPQPTADTTGAGLIVVQLPEVALRDTSGRWAAALVLDGLRYIIARADDKADIVINLSLGAFGGPHDGSSMLEEAIDALIFELKGRLTVVVAAGNASEPRNDGDGKRRWCHAQAVLAAAGNANDQCTLVLDIDQADATETFVELWLPEATVAAGEFAGVTVELLPPGPPVYPAIIASPGTLAIWHHNAGAALVGGTPVGGASATTIATEVAPASAVGAASTGSVALAQVVNLSGRGGEGARGKGPMVLVAIGTTRDVTGYRAPVGQWQIKASNARSVPITLEAWVERRDVPGELAGERPQYGFEDTPGIARPDTNTLGSLANGAKTIVVAGAEFSVGSPPKIAQMSSKSQGPPPAIRSGAPPLQRKVRAYAGPAIAAPAEFAAAGFLTGSYKTLKGTSMSAAWVTRIIAAEFIAHADVRAWLIGLAQAGGNAPPPDTDWLLRT